MCPVPRKRRILVAEDIRATAVRIAYVLEKHGYEVETVHNGAECLASIELRKPDLLLLDLMLPLLNGIEVLKRLRSIDELRELPVVVCTAKDFTTDIRSVLDLGVADIIIKPFENDTILQKVDHCLADEGTLHIPTKAAATKTINEMYAPEVRGNRAKLTLWGTRGSIPVSGVQYLRHGGNTSCVEYSCGSDRIIFDAGSGLREAAVAALSGGPRHLHLFLTHTHWDHINGFPFFTPMFIPGYEVTIYGERGFGKDFETLLTGQLDRDYFPAERQDLRAKIHFQTLDEKPIQIGDIKVTRAFTNHPGATVAFKIEHRGRSVAYVPDNEFLQGYVGHPAKIERGNEMVVPQEPLLEFLKDVDVLLHEAQYLAPEYLKKIGWGHSNLANACVLAKFATPKKWIVIHHDPAHNDTYLDQKIHLTRQILEDIECAVPVVHGYDGMVNYL